MRTKIFVTLIVMLSMFMVCAAESTEEGTFEIDDTIVDDVYLDLTVDYDAEIGVGGRGNTNYRNGDYDIEGTISISDETYNVDMTAEGWIRMRDSGPDGPSADILRARLNIDGKAYQNGETQYLYKDGDNRYYGHIESGYYVDGYLRYGEYKNNERLIYDLNFDEYSMYVTTMSKPMGEFTLSSPSLGLGYKGSIAGDSIPELFTYRDTNTWKRVVSETYPTDHDGPVIVTPARIAGEPLQETGYWDTAKGQRVSEWKANNN